MALTPAKQRKKMAQAWLRQQGFYSGEIDGLWGAGSNAAYDAYKSFLDSKDLEIGDEDPLLEDPTPASQVTGVVVLDPGHGGGQKIGGSSPNNAVSASGVKEKAMTLALAKLIKQELQALPQTDISVFLTRADDSNLGLADRAAWAAQKNANLFVSIHFNGFNGSASGTETWIASANDGNQNEAADRQLAERLQRGMLAGLSASNFAVRDRGIKNHKRLGVLRGIQQANSRDQRATRACLVEVEFIDVPAVDELLNVSPQADSACRLLAQEMALAIVDDLEAQS